MAGASPLVHCRFGPLLVPAQWVSNEELRCVTPGVLSPSRAAPTEVEGEWLALALAANATAAVEVSFILLCGPLLFTPLFTPFCSHPSAHTLLCSQVSFNGQDFTAGGPAFEYIAEVEITSLSPASGPLAGGTLVSVFGGHLTGVSVHSKLR